MIYFNIYFLLFSTVFFSIKYIFLITRKIF